MQINFITAPAKNNLELQNTTIGVYNTHKDAIMAVQALDAAGIPVKNISFLSTAVIREDNLQTYSTKNIKNAPVAIGAVLGPLLGILVGASILAVPGLGFLYGAGAVVGAIAGFNIGIVSGGIGTLLMTLGIKKDKVVTYQKHLKEGKFLVILQGDKVITAKAKKIAHRVGNYIELVIM